MKTLILIFYAITLSAFGQSTNSLRIVNGKIYNPALSTNWITLPGYAGNMLKVEKSTSEGILIKEYQPTFDYSDRSIRENTKEEYVVKNMPREDSLTTGTKLSRMKVMRVGTVSIDGKTLGLYDYGKPYKP